MATCCFGLLLLGHDFIVRVGSNVTLLRGLGWEYEQRGSTVYLWPRSHRKRSPLVLRLVEIRSKGKRVYLLTSVRGRELLKDGEVALLYRLRWGIEVMYRVSGDTIHIYAPVSNARGDEDRTTECACDAKGRRAGRGRLAIVAFPAVPSDYGRGRWRHHLRSRSRLPRTSPPRGARARPKCGTVTYSCFRSAMADLRKHVRAMGARAICRNAET